MSLPSWRLLAALVVLAVVGTVGLTAWVDARAERRFWSEVPAPFVQRSVTVDGVSWRYLEAGEGPPLVCLHGAYGGAEDWVVTVGVQLAERFRVLAIDRPGHGFSERGRGVETPSGQAAALIGLFDALDLERPLMAGFSWGGAVTAACLAEAPERVRGAVLLGAPLYPWDGEVSAIDRVLSTPVLGPLVAHGGASLLARGLAPSMLTEAFAPESAPSAYLERSPVPLALRASALVHNSIDMAGLNAALAVQQNGYSRVSAPIEVVHGDGDQVVWTTHHAQPFCAAVPSAVLTELPGAGHQLLYTRAPEVLAAFGRLADRVASRDDG